MHTRGDQSWADSGGPTRTRAGDSESHRRGDSESGGHGEGVATATAGWAEPPPGLHVAGAAGSAARPPRHLVSFGYP